MTSRIDQIARQAAVSKATVSRVLNERPGVSLRLQKAVLTAIDVLGLERPSSLRPRSSGLVGLIIPSLEDPVYPILAQVVQTNLGNLGYTPVLCIQDQGSTKEDEYVGLLLDRGVSGIIFVAGRHSDTKLDGSHYDALEARHLPMVFVNGFMKGVAAPFVSCDDRAAGALAVQHLISLGHSRIGLLLSSATSISDMRLADGYRDFMSRSFGEMHDEWIDVSFGGEEGGYAGALRLLDKGVTAIACGSDLLAIGAIHALRQHGKRVPEDISVVGYGDSKMMSYMATPLTTVRQPMLAMGTFTSHILVDCINGDETPSGESLFPPELVVRGSTAVHQ